MPRFFGTKLQKVLKVDSGKPIAKRIDAVDQWQFVNNKQYLL